MTVIDPLPADMPADPARPAAWWARAGELMDRASERLNPILVKEARQSLKSMQFTITFSLMLVCAWVWSLLGVAMQMPGIYYGAGGPLMLVGYFFILAFPLLVVVPFAAYRSLAAEWEDGTYELLSITTLPPRRIIGGKLGSAVIQIVVYLSALSPCIAFTYMLRGIDVASIGVLLAHTTMASMLLTVVGLMIATVTRLRQLQVMVSVLLIPALLFVFGGACSLVAEMFDVPLPTDSPGFWVGNTVIVVNWAAYFLLFYTAAAVRVTFATDNRSTRVRMALLVQQLVMFGSFVWLWLFSHDEEPMAFFWCYQGFHWMIIGSMLVGESTGSLTTVRADMASGLLPKRQSSLLGFFGAMLAGETISMSPRVQRSLPQSFLGRVFLSPFFPGPGSGFNFIVGNLSASVNVFLLVMLVHLVRGTNMRNTEELTMLAAMIFSYVVAYVGLTRLLLSPLRRVMPVTVLTGLVFCALLVILGTVVPLIVQFSLFYHDDYTILQITNPFWTTVEMVKRSRGAGIGSVFLYLGFDPALIVFYAGVLLILLANLIANAREARYVRVATPPRVLEDEAELHPPPPQKPVKSSPWDDDVPDQGKSEASGDNGKAE